jgi:hypothetical protein
MAQLFSSPSRRMSTSAATLRAFWHCVSSTDFLEEDSAHYTFHCRRLFRRHALAAALRRCSIPFGWALAAPAEALTIKNVKTWAARDERLHGRGGWMRLFASLYVKRNE